jgi:hypothetical protein
MFYLKLLITVYRTHFGKSLETAVAWDNEIRGNFTFHKPTPFFSCVHINERPFYTFRKIVSWAWKKILSVNICFKIVNIYIRSNFWTFLLCKHWILQSMFDIHRHLYMPVFDKTLHPESPSTSLVKLIGWLMWFFLVDHSSLSVHDTYVI